MKSKVKPSKVEGLQRSGWRISNEHDGTYIRAEHGGYVCSLEAGSQQIRDIHAAAPETAAERDRLKEVNAELLKALKDTLQALEAHLNESARDHNIKNIDLLCPCSKNEVVKARQAIKVASEGRAE